MLCTSGFKDDIIFSHNGSTACHVYLIEYDKYNSRDSKRIFLDDKIHQVLIVNCVLGAKSAIYESLVNQSGF